MNNTSTLTSTSSFLHESQKTTIKTSSEAARVQENISEKKIEKQFLTADEVEISQAAQKKLSEAEQASSEENSSETKDTIAGEKVEAETSHHESDIDKEIRELSLEILEITVKIEMLDAKEDQESIKEKQALEVSLAKKKGQLDAMLEQKLQMAARS